MTIRILRTCFTILCLAFAFSAASAAPIDLVLNTPPNTSTVTGTTFLFQWEETIATSYRFQLRSADGTQSLKITVSSDTCDEYCVLTFIPANYDWAWHDHTTYTWQVKALDATMSVVVKSPKYTFKTDLLSTIQVISPVNKFKTNSAFVTFTWDVSSKIDQYRLLLTAANGTQSGSPWTDKAQLCAASCILEYSFGKTDAAKYTWKIQGRRADVAGKVNSGTRTVTANK